MSSFQQLAERLRDLPGIGPRQAQRFAYFLLTRRREYLEELARLIVAVKKDTKICTSCFRFFNGNSTSNECPICADPGRNKDTLLILEKDVDLENMEKSGSYRGHYFVLGGTLPILEKKPEEKIRSRELSARIKKEVEKNLLKEVILAFSVNAEGENTREYIESLLRPYVENSSFKISNLGRGLSTGSELEYADSDTLRSALANRK